MVRSLGLVPSLPLRYGQYVKLGLVVLGQQFHNLLSQSYLTCHMTVDIGEVLIVGQRGNESMNLTVDSVSCGL